MADSSKTVYLALASNAVVMVAKFMAGFASGSSSLLAEGVHSVADTGDQVMVLLGRHRSKRPEDPLHPFGHGRELYFWTLVVAVSIFGIGGCASILEGLDHLVHPQPLESPLWSFVALGIAFVAEGASMIYSWRQFMREKGAGRTVAQGIAMAKDPTTFIVVFEDTAAIFGLIVAATFVALAHGLKVPRLDGAGALGVGLIMASVAVFLISEIRKLLIGERAVPHLLDAVRQSVQADSAVRRCEPARSTHFGPETVLITLRVEFDPTMPAAEVAAAIQRLHHALQQEHPEIKYLYIEPWGPEASAAN